MIYTDKLTTELNDFLKFDIKFNEKNNQYLFKGKWASEIDEDYFEERILKLKIQLQAHLKIGNNNKQFLTGLLETIWNTVDWYKENSSYRLAFIEQIKAKIKSDSNIETKPPLEKFDHEFIKNFQYDTEVEKSDYVLHFQRYAKETNNYKEVLDFEKVKLLYCIHLFTESLLEFYYFVYSIKDNLDFIDFDKLMTEDYIFSNNPEKVKCHVNLKKNTAAQLFNILISEKYFFIDKHDEKNNKQLMQKFIEENFTYKSIKDKKEKQLDIVYMTREFSELHWENLNGQIEFIDDFISKLENIKEKIEKKKNS